ncbi:MAG: peptide chain release factor N(5)-glutamine methyltransferase, partial [Paracoccaceae bacterium]|nr:peptide chain release factor N(5)-glutamine methyltransferase [Paracoccaceae bacterium]
MIAQAILVTAVQKLRTAGVPDPARDARILLACAMNISAGRLTLHLQDDCGQTEITAFEKLIAQRETRQPISQILGKRSFYGRDFIVTANVLD